MANNVEVPFNPQQGITQQILAAIQLANEHHAQNQQAAIQQQQANTAQTQAQTAQQKAPSDIQESLARAGLLGLQKQEAQQQLDNMRKVNGVFSPDTAAPSPMQSVSMTPGTAQPAAPWLPSHTPPQMAPMVSAMLPKDLTPEEQNIIESGAQPGALEAQQTGDMSKYLGAIGKQADTVLQNRAVTARQPENQPPSSKEIDNFVTNVVPQFDNLTSSQKSALTLAARGATTTRELELLQNRALQQDAASGNSKMMRQIAEDNLKANRKVTIDSQKDMEGRRQIIAATTKDSDALQSTNIALKTIDAAKDGNDLATRMVPLMEVLGINGVAGIRRINPSELQQASVPVGWVDRWNAWAAGATGKLNVQQVTEGKKLLHDLADAKYSSYMSTVGAIANTYIDPENRNSISIIGKDGKVVKLGDAMKQEPTTTAQAGPPAGATMKVPGSDGKLHWSDGKQDLGLAE